MSLDLAPKGIWEPCWPLGHPWSQHLYLPCSGDPALMGLQVKWAHIHQAYLPQWLPSVRSGLWSNGGTFVLHPPLIGWSHRVLHQWSLYRVKPNIFNIHCGGGIHWWEFGLPHPRAGCSSIHPVFPAHYRWCPFPLATLAPLHIWPKGSGLQTLVDWLSLPNTVVPLLMLGSSGRASSSHPGMAIHLVGTCTFGCTLVQRAWWMADPLVWALSTLTCTMQEEKASIGSTFWVYTTLS